MNKKTVLLVEDNPGDRALIVRALKRVCRTCEVVIARNNVEALDYLLGARAHDGRDMADMPALVLLDLTLSWEDGLKVLQHIRGDDRTKLIPVVIFLPDQKGQDGFDGYNLGASGCLRKTADAGKFTKAVGHLGAYWLLSNEPPPKRVEVWANMPLRVLMIEESGEDAALILQEIRRGGYDVAHERVWEAAAFTTALRRQTWDVILADYTRSKFNGLDALELLWKSGLDLPFIIVSNAISEKMAVAAMKAGVHDYLTKNNLARLIPAIERELRAAEVRRDIRRAEEEIRKLREGCASFSHPMEQIAALRKGDMDAYAASCVDG